MSVVFFNGSYINLKDYLVAPNSRAYNYGDGFFETIKIINSKPINLLYHNSRIKLALKLLKFENMFINYEDYILNIVTRNNLIHGTIKLHFTRTAGGKYFPTNNCTNLFISYLVGNKYVNNSPISLCLYHENKKYPGYLSNIKSTSSLIYVMSSIYAKEKKFNNSLILNSLDRIIETDNSNIFYVLKNKLYTPNLSDGCVSGVMREWIINNFDVLERSLSHNDFPLISEFLVSNTANGVTTVNKVDDFSFNNYRISTEIQNKLINSC